MDIQVCDKHLIYSVLISRYWTVISEYSVSLLSKPESVEFSLIESVIWLFTDSSVQKYFSLTNQLISIDWINEKIFFTVKSVDFHWSNQWNLTDLQ